MAASMISYFPVEYDYSNSQSSPKSQTLQPVWNLNSNRFVILSDNTLRSSSDIEGFLYIPTPDGACANITGAANATGVTHLDSIPPASQFNRIAFGPWVNDKSCVLKSLADANTNNATAFYTYLPDPTAVMGPPPPNASDGVWDLGDNGQWKSTYGFPVYAITASDANQLMSKVALYSGNLSSTPDGGSLASTYHFSDNATIRLYTQAAIPNGAQLPSLWVFLLIVLGILLAVLVVASGVMRVVQRRRRRELQRMIANGEVNLEALGVARVKVTEEILSKMPLCIYVEHGDKAGPAHAPRPDSSVIDQGIPADKASKLRQIMNREKKDSTAPTTKLPDKIEEKVVLFPQDSCVICLDEYENHATPVKWLPCSHVFHPACIDPLLREYSSLCPICKASVLPKDYIPEITNVMVRRERLNRRFREIERQERERVNTQRNMPVHFGGIGRFVRVNAQDSAQQDNAATAQPPQINVQDVEMQAIQPAVTAPSSGSRPLAMERSASGISAASAARRPEGVSREDWARQRAAALVGTSETVEEAERNQEARRPIWRRVLGPIFPNLR